MMQHYQYPVPPYNGYYPQGTADLHQIQINNEKKDLKKTSNGLGFFVLVYFLVMIHVAAILTAIMSLTHSLTQDNQSTMMFLLQIIISVSSALIAGFFYRIISKRRISDFLPKSHVPFKILIPLIFLGMGAAMLANTLAGLFDTNISIFELENTAVQTSSADTPSDYWLYVISTAVVPAFAEELAFRGIFMSIMRKYGDSFAILTSAIMFGTMHGNTTQIIFAFVLGLIFAYVDCKANSIVPSIIIHFTNNFYAVFSDIINTNPVFDETTSMMIRIGIIIMFCLLGVLSYIYLASADKSFFKISENDKNIFSDSGTLTLKEKMFTFFKTAGVIISLCLFAAEMITYLIPENITDIVTG